MDPIESKKDVFMDPIESEKDVFGANNIVKKDINDWLPITKSRNAKWCEAAESEKAKSAILKELEGEGEGKERKGEELGVGVLVPVVRLKLGEVAEASRVVVLPVCRAEEGQRKILEAPWECRGKVEFGVVVAESEWERWVVLLGWEPLVGLDRGGVVAAFPEARVLPWKANRWYKEESVLVFADSGRKEVKADDGFYLVTLDSAGGEFKVERGSALKDRNVVESLGTVVVVVRPPKEETDDQMNDEDWERNHSELATPFYF
ncbi:unnamed protein product [Dovyalis caffra]|uniref:Rubisco accumulation factor 1 C-terminal domain-containing protein n=1 Tax=Dovyalis caffra TaxID=77055 RepID=A0AAV1RMP1_9ROSI|nr:unnamed protein product [Dovyalis caffra]